jgi:hypothetical protein
MPAHHYGAVCFKPPDNLFLSYCTSLRDIGAANVVVNMEANDRFFDIKGTPPSMVGPNNHCDKGRIEVTIYGCTGVKPHRIRGSTGFTTRYTRMTTR